MNVGDIVSSQRTYEDLPVGSTIRGSYVWTKMADGTWSRPGSGGRPVVRESDSLNVTGRVRINSLGTGSLAVVTVDTPLTTAEQWANLPEGVIIGRPGYGAEQHYRAILGGFVNVMTGDHYPRETFSRYHDGRYEVVAIPRDAKRTFETPDKFMWMFNQVVASAAQEHGVPQSTVTDAIRAIGHEVPPPAKGAEVRWQQTREALPTGTIVYCGYPQSKRFGVFKRTPRNWVHVMGPTTGMDNLCFIDYVPGGVDSDWALDPGSEETEAEAARLRAIAWKVALKVKHAHGWCGELEQIVARAGLNENSINAVRDFSLRVGHTVTLEQAAPLPPGTIFRWEDGANYCYYKRSDERSRNVARTRRIFGHRSDGGPLRHYATSMTILHLGDENMNLRLPIDGEKFDALPPGAAWHFNGDAVTGPSYVKAQDGRAAQYQRGIPAVGTWTFRDLVGSTASHQFTFTHLESL